jgi:AmpE protein
MSLISLLIALAAEKYLSSSAWQFKTYYQHYLKLFSQAKLSESSFSANIVSLFFIATPTVACYLLLTLVDDGLLHLVISTLILITCFGCVKTRDSYKKYLMAAFRGEPTSCELHHQQLQQDKNEPEMSFGQLLVWLNYRYFIAIMIFFVVFGAPGALFYRLLTTVNEKTAEYDSNGDEEKEDESNNQAIDAEHSAEAAVIAEHDVADGEASSEDKMSNHTINQDILFWLDWVPVRIVAFGYMLVGHFSKAMPIWLENLFDVNKQPNSVLIAVAEKSEDFMIDKDDCTAEPCLLVRLAKRTLLLCLAVIAVLILTGVLS